MQSNWLSFPSSVAAMVRRDRGALMVDEMAHLFQEYKYKLSSSLVLAMEKLSWEFQQFSIPSFQRNVLPPPIWTRLSAINRHPFFLKGGWRRCKPWGTVLTPGAIPCA